MMKIELKEITIRDLTEGYKDSIDVACRVTAFGGNLVVDLDVRPKYQRLNLSIKKSSAMPSIA